MDAPFVYALTVTALAGYLGWRLYATQHLLSELFGQLTDAREDESEFQHQATHDPLTGLLNRLGFERRLMLSIEKAHREGTSVLLICVDLDHFKEVNDTHGHAAGDDLLCQVADRLRECVRGGDVIARLGGDEFAIVLASVDRIRAEAIAIEIVLALHRGFTVEGHPVAVTGSVGAAFYPSDARTREDLTRAADRAMYTAKHKGRNAYHFHP